MTILLGALVLVVLFLVSIIVMPGGKRRRRRRRGRSLDLDEEEDSLGPWLEELVGQGKTTIYERFALEELSEDIGFFHGETSAPNLCYVDLENW